MARNFPSGAGAPYLLVANPANPPLAGSILFRFRPGWSSGDSGDHILWAYAGDGTLGTSSLDFDKYLDNNVYIGWIESAVADHRLIVSDAGLFTAGAWSNYIYTWNALAPSQEFFVNGVSVASSAAAFTTSPLASFIAFSVGAAAGGGTGVAGGANAFGDGGELARWTRVIAQPEIDQLQLYFAPSFFQAGLDRYYPMMGRDSPEPDIVGGVNLPLIGAPGYAPGPRGILPSNPIIRALAATAPPVGGARRGDSNILVGAV